MKTKPIAVLAACAFFLASCGQSPTTKTVNSNDSQPTPAPIQAEAFHGQVYKSLNGRTVLTLISKDECELSEQGTILLCKYTKQDDKLRVVTTALGTSQVLYYRFTNQGLQDNNGNVLFSPEVYLELQRQAEIARRAKQEAKEAEERRLDAMRAESKKESSTIKTNQLAGSNLNGGPWTKVTITDVSVKFESAQGEVASCWYGDISYVERIWEVGAGYRSTWQTANGYYKLELTGDEGKSDQVYGKTDVNGVNKDFCDTLKAAIEKWVQRFPELSRYNPNH
jgi:hypothetical protein